MNTAYIIAKGALSLAAFFFWARGLVKSQQDDIVLGFAVFVFVYIASIVNRDESSLLIVLFGLETLIAGLFARDDCPIRPNDRMKLGLGAILAGLFFALLL